MFMTINCKKCGNRYCTVCEKACPECGEIDVVDKKTMSFREKMRRKDVDYITQHKK